MGRQRDIKDVIFAVLMAMFLAAAAWNTLFGSGMSGRERAYRMDTESPDGE